MTENKSEIGSISWADLTVSNAEEVRNFYSQVIGWKFELVSMGEYSNYNMLTPKSGAPAAGVCHTLGVNAALPAQWLIYITVANIEESIRVCKELGGKILIKPKNYGSTGKYCVIQDIAGAVCAIFEQNNS